MDADLLRRYLEFYQDLGIRTLYRQAAARQPEPEPAAAQKSPLPSVELPLPPLAPANDSLLKILEDMGDCRRCRLHEGRTKLVFGVGDEHAPLVFLGGLLLLCGLMMFSTGLIGEVVIRTYFESQDRRIYAVREVRSRKARGVAGGAR